MSRYPTAFSQLLMALDFRAVGPREIVIAGEREDATVRAMLSAVRGTFLPQRVVALAWDGADPDFMPLLKERASGPTGGLAYVCRDYACQAPVDSVEDLREQLRT